MKLIISPFQDPYKNLAIENYFFRRWEKLDDAQREEESDILFLYVNSPCVVLGRFQNPWKELHWPSIRSSRMPIVRRQSGGGTVYHDLGNLNFSFISGQREIKKESNLDRLRSFFQRHWDVKIRRTSMFDMMMSKEDGEYKVSGNAFKQGRVSSIHHGTLLIESSLSHLDDSLDKLPLEIETKAVDSRPKSVMNISEVNDQITIESCLEHFKAEYPILETDLEAILSDPETVEYMNKLQSDEWRFGETPKFKLREQFDFSWGNVKVKFDVKKSKLNLVHLSSNIVKTDWSVWERKLEGQQLYSRQIFKEFSKEVKDVEDKELKEFLQVFLSWMMMSFQL